MKTSLLTLCALALALTLSGCQSLSEHDAKMRADLEAGRLAAIEGRKAALVAMEAVKGITPSK